MEYLFDGIYYTNTKNKYIAKWKSVTKRLKGLKEKVYNNWRYDLEEKLNKCNGSGVGL